jgi:hypothetical protein
MKSALLLGLLGALSYSPCGETKKEMPVANEIKQVIPIAATIATTPIDFQKQLQPIFQKHCNPCHFPGGKMYARLPFDKAETMLIMDARPGILKRIKEEEENKLIREYFEQNKK